jgi:hypothetical protein
MDRRTISAALLFLTVILGTSQAPPQGHLPLAVPAVLAQAPPQTAEGGEASLARNFYFVFDGSGSMGEALNQRCTGDKRFQSRLAGAKWAVEKFMPHVPDAVNLGLWVFDAYGNSERVALGPGNREQFLSEIGKISAGRKTPLTEAITQAVDRLVRQRDKQLGYGEFRLIVVTDGEATGQPLSQAVQYARAQRIPIYTIGLCLGETHALRQYSVAYRAADSIEALRRGLEEMLAETQGFDPQTFPGQ